MIAAAKSSYARRGQPAQTTGWGPSEIHSYMKFQFHQYKCGRLSKRRLGGWAWNLPKKGPTGEPAELPSEALDFLAGGRNPDHSEKKKRKARSEDSDKAKDGKKNKKRSSPSPDATVQYAIDTWFSCGGVNTEKKEHANICLKKQ